MHILFCRANQKKRVTEGNNKRLNLWKKSINWVTKFLIPPDWVTESDFCQIPCVVLEFFVKKEALDCFSRPNALPKFSKITKICLN